MRHIYRLISLVIFFSIALSSFAKLYKDDDGYWVITNADDLRELAYDRTKFSDKFKQIADIDLKGDTIKPIGNHTYPFKGEYDGQGYSIKNLKIYWDFKDANEVSYGLFSFVSGTKDKTAKLHNIVLDNVSVTRSELSDSHYDSNNDLKIGLLAGAITHYVNIQNILIDGCHIDDGGRDGEEILVHGLFVGGAIGDFANSYNGTSNLGFPTNPSDFAIKNIVVNNTHINLNNVNIDIKDIASNKPHERYQFYLGGVVGRIRSPKLEHIPTNVVFSGTLKAKYAFEAPIIGSTRCVDLAANQIQYYAGQIFRPEDGVVSTIYDYYCSYLKDPSAFEAFCNTRRYFNYSSYNSNGTAVDPTPITANVPGSGAYSYGTRTFRENKPVPTFDTNASTRAYVQGVNFGHLTDMDNESVETVDMLQNAVNESKTYNWRWDGNKFEYVRNFPIDWYKIRIVLDKNTGMYEAKLFFIINKKECETVPTNLKWYTSASLTDADWIHVSGDDNKSRINPDRSLYYKVEWTDEYGTVHTSDYFAPMKTVYVFNPATNQDFNNDYEDSYHNTYNTDYPNAGNDDNNGLTPETAVLTMRRAYDILDEFGDVTTNKIVVMGYYIDDKFLSDNTYNNKIYDGDYIVPTTITGTDNERIFNGTLAFKDKIEYKYLSAPLRLDNIDFSRHYKLASSSANFIGTTFIVCNYFDLTIDENVRFINGGYYPANYGLPEDISSVPDMNIIGGTQDSNFDPITDPIRYPSDIYPDRKGMYSEPGVTNIIVRSGCFGRIICCSRNINTVHDKSLNITGSYLVPNRIRLTVDYKNDIDLNDPDHQATAYGVNTQYINNKISYTPSNYSHNIGLIAGGQTDGSAYGDVEINVYGGYIGRIINGNITYGRRITKTISDGLTEEVAPTDSYYGRAVLNIYGKTYYDADNDRYTSETTINEVFGGMLGRIGDPGTRVCRPYFYGTSEINMYGGYIGPYTGKSNDRGLDKLKKLIPSLYGAGSGGVAGLGDANNHTSDPFIPYLDDGQIVYQAYDATKTMPVMEHMLDATKIDLNNTNCYVNLYGGVVHGSVYGAGYGYSNNIPSYDHGLGILPSDLGALYGNSYITMQKHPDYLPAVVLGNLYGSGAGDKRYAKQWDDDHQNLDADERLEQNPYLAVAAQYGNAYVNLQAGTIGDAVKSTGGDVFGGSQGIAGYENVAALFGGTDITIDGATVYGNIFGGSELANIRKYEGIEGSGNTILTVNSGIIGNNIFGGSKGIDSPDGKSDSKAIIEGSTNVTINGGNFIDNPYIKLQMRDNSALRVDAKGNKINIVDNREFYRTFNIYGGGYMNCDVQGDANLSVYSSLLCSDRSFVDIDENPNALDEHNESHFQSAYMDITFRNFCVYGGGFGEKTNVLNTNVYITIPEERSNATQPHGTTLSRYLDHQSFFDIAGGGYSGDVGYWANVDDVPVSKIPTPTIADLPLTAEELNTLTDEELQTRLDNHIVSLYHHYVGGNCNVIIDGYTFARKVIGGGFYGSCKNTNTHVRCGLLRQVYGGSLLGYVHDQAYLQFGNRTEDFIEKRDDGTYGFNHTGVYDFDGNVSHIQSHDPHIWSAAASRAKELNNFIFITENIYGGNDVKGIIGTQKWTSPEGNYGIDKTDGGPLYQTDVKQTEHKGIVLNIYGGTFMGDVYSAGNGHYRGYYVPEWVRYNDGPDRMYRTVKSSVDPTKTGKAYRSRPMVGSVNVNLRGNAEDDFITINGNFFGGGRECSIGQYDTFLPLEDPRRLQQGGHLHVNMGGYVHVDGNVYMGAEGKLYAEQAVVPAGINVNTFDGSTTKALATLGDAAYDHWYYNADKKCYLPGYPAPGEVDGNFGMTGEHMFYAYMKNIEMEGDVELTFYRYLYERDSDGNYIVDQDGVRSRKRWVPGEKAMSEYDAQDVRMNSFFLGGLCGSMTNNKVMIYDYTDGSTYDESDPDKPSGHDLESWGSIYRIALPPGVTIRENVVMGSQDAITKIFKYKDGYTAIDPEQELYRYEGGMVTHSAQAFDLILYNAFMYPELSDDTQRELPADFYTPGRYIVGNGDNRNLYELNDFEKHIGDVTYHIHRFNYKPDDHHYLSDVQVGGHNIGDPRYALAVTYVDGDVTKPAAYIGRRVKRRASGIGTDVADINKDKMTVTKLTCKAQFDLMGDKSDLTSVYGGNVYGGCYNSGLVIGDAVINISSDLLGNTFSGLDESLFSEYSSLKYNIGRVFGGGFGDDTTNDGDTYVNILRDFRGMNVFGGGMEGDITGTTNITYIGNEDVSMIYGSIYGGGLHGAVGTPQVTTQATSVRLFSGNVRNVYGGSCMGELYGRTFVELCDAVDDNFTHFDYHRFLQSDTYADLLASRLIVGNVFGGNDIAGVIHRTIERPTPVDPTQPATIEEQFRDYSTGVYIHEVKADAGNTSPNTVEKTSPGSVNGYNAFPLVGNLYGGSNGAYGVHGTDGKYAVGEVEIATGIDTKTKKIYLNGVASDHSDALAIPHVESAHIMIAGGSVVNGYGGGDMATITDDVRLTLNYPQESMDARAGFKTVEELDRVWSVLHFSNAEQREEVSRINEDGNPIFDFQVFKLFGGNNKADMAIQPDWQLTRGYVGSLYSGGNFGKMTFYQEAKPEVPAEGTEPAIPAKPAKGLTLTIDSPDIYIDYLYGGGRVGDIAPNIPKTVTPGEDFYGATLNVVRGIIDHVYGGNDVAGYIDYGTNVNLYGAISGDVYCAGNGNYSYKYDRAGDLDYSNGTPFILETYEPADDPNYPGQRYFLLPQKDGYIYSGNNADAITVLAINSYRPHVERAKLTIAGTEDNSVWVRGRVFCGGNSSSIVPKVGATKYDVKFDIGSYVTLNGVFMGSNGESLSLGETMLHTERLNAFNGTDLNMVSVNNLTRDNVPASDWDIVDHKELYPTTLDLYMRAVEVVDKPADFDFDDDITNAYIGDFCVGGNRGSMMTNKTIALTFPRNLTIFHSIIGGCMDANVTYRGMTHIGGLTKPLASDYDHKVKLNVKSRFLPLFINYPDEVVTPPISISSNFVDADGNSIMVRVPGGTSSEYEVDPAFKGTKYYANGQCNIFGGCYTSGTTVGDIDLHLYSDMLNYDGADVSYSIDKKALADGLVDKSWRSFTVVGGGYGANTAVYGDIHVALLPEKVGTVVKHPSAATIFGGSQEGLVVGNTTVELRDGKVFANVYGASEAAQMYGSTQVIVGYPKYYRAIKSGIYGVNRIDYLSDVANTQKRDEKGKIVVSKSIGYRVGDLVPACVYETLNGRYNVATGFEIGVEPAVSLRTTDTREACFEPVTSSVKDGSGNLFDHIVPQDYGVEWSDITIWVGDQDSNNDPSKTYYGFGNVYGGGFIPNSSDRSLVGQYTVLRYTDKYPDKEGNYGLGGNTSVMVWDDLNNADLSISESSIRDHIHLATGRFKEVDTSGLNEEQMKRRSKKGLFEHTTRTVDGNTVNAYVYQTNGRMEYGKKYYEKEADGGLYGAGRKVFVEGFTAIDLAYYGYAGHSPQSPKLLNTIQRADMVQVTDCCMELVGASDFTVDEYKDISYAINRVGELRMESSLDFTEALDPGYVDPATTDGVRLHIKKRSRNYMALYNKTNHLAAFRSNWNLDRPYHLDNGNKTTEIDTDYGYALSDRDGYTHLTRNESYVNHKHRFIDLYDQYMAVKKSVEGLKKTGESIITLATKIRDLKSAYEAFANTEVNEIEDPNLATVLNTLYSDLSTAIEEIFRQRNVGTSANMIGISSGYELSVEGLACQRGENDESRYYGPAYGVTEIKLLTTVSGMGGGYVYALNHHYDPTFDKDAHRDVPAKWCSKFGPDKPTFLQTTGNFVFPGASYHTTDNKEKHNFIIDDCFDHFDPINHGYYACDGHDRVVTRAPERSTSRDGSANHVNTSHEVHYWYVSGNTYVYNATITAFTSDPTTGKPQRDFYFNNENDLINLFNVKDENTIITVEEVTWFKHGEESFGPCDIDDLNKNYALYLTIDRQTRNDYTTGVDNSAYVLRVPRFSYVYAIDSTTGEVVNELKSEDAADWAFIDKDSYLAGGGEPNDLIINPNPDADGFSTGYISTLAEPNTPRLGLHLIDAQKNRFADEEPEVGQQYYEQHLQPDHQLQVTLKTVNKRKDGQGNEEPIFYVINIDIKYLMGPAVYGKINIENCALPGEYIYANADDVEVIMDEDLGISEQSWRMYPNDADGHRYIRESLPGGTDPALRIDPVTKQVYIPLDTEEFTVANTEKLVHIPAYYYMNGWELAYLVTANGEEFESTLPYYIQEEQTIGGKKVLVDTDVPNPANRLQVHNYHRMKPVYNGQTLDLRLVPGARVYLEDNADMKYFLEYLDQLQGDALASGSTLKRFATLDGRTVNPPYAAGLDFYQQEHLTVPVASDFTQVNKALVFKCNYHGNGHWMIIPADALVNIEVGHNGGIYNLGFVSDVPKDRANAIFENNQGIIQNCFYFNSNEGGTLTVYDKGTVKNCYQNTPADSRFKYNELLKLSTAGFRYGQAAYNLNGFYLDKRHRLLHYGEDPVLNNAPALKAKDSDVRRESITDPSAYDAYAVEYIEKMFNDGDYRYAYSRIQLDGIGSQFTEALRTSTVPNYFDYLGQRNNNLSVTMHKTTHDVDESRWCSIHKEYHPIYDIDYLFFGENLTVDVDEHNSHLPELYSPETRVYRVGGFYGTADDKGYFLNKEAYVDSEVMTAIDFVGYRDRKMYDQTTGLIISDVRDDIDADGWIFEHSNSRHQVYMPPTLDVPWVGDAETGHIEFDSFDLNPDKVTHNLLIYTHNTEHAIDVMSGFHYTDQDPDLGKTNRTFAVHPEDGIQAHHIIDYASGPRAYGDMMHLVDLHDFNAPVAFDVKEAWYNRKPADYADEYTVTEGTGLTYKYKSAWEGICLPFNVLKTYAASTNVGSMRDMGEITHFYGDDYKAHEYWLRRLSGVDATRDALLFERPKADNERPKADNVGLVTDYVADYTYRNKALHDIYMPYDYNEDHDLLYHYTDPATQYRVMAGYRHLTHNMPYVVTYPGERYYEFDLSGNFYLGKNPQPDFAVPQTICYFANGKTDDVGGLGTDYVTIPVTDDTPMVTYTAGDYTMVGTFAHVTNNAELKAARLYKLVPNLHVLDYQKVNDNSFVHQGEVFSNEADVVVPPFRTYVYTTSGSSSAPMRIGDGESRAIDEIIEEVDPDEDPDDSPEDTGIRVWVEGNALMIYTPYNLETNIYNISGQNIRRIRAYEGVNRYTGLPTGFYITLRNKVYIP